VRLENPAGLTGVWAEENTRASIWDAIHRRETFATSGPHMRIRLFGGWEYDADTAKKLDWVKIGYAKGVTMGSDLPPPKGKAPTFIVWATKDPTAGNLDRIQIVKGWTKDGQSFEKIFDVVWAGNRKPDKWTGKVPAIGSTVDVDAATYTNAIGAAELKTVWTDPEFDPGLHAFYYARALEIPTPRWTTIQAQKLGIAPPDVVPATIQERAWSSPIWYTPSAEARKNVQEGLTVATLRKQGATPLSDAQLKALLVGKAPWWRNTVTGEPFKVRYDTDGRAVVLHVGAETTVPSDSGNVARSGYLTVPKTYAIKNGKLVEFIDNTPFEITVYKLKDAYYAARSNEFGHANYELMPKGPPNLVKLKGASQEAPPPGYQD
jgi:hypothetical protein